MRFVPGDMITGRHGGAYGSSVPFPFDYDAPVITGIGIVVAVRNDVYTPRMFVVHAGGIGWYVQEHLEHSPWRRDDCYA